MRRIGELCERERERERERRRRKRKGNTGDSSAASSNRIIVRRCNIRGRAKA